MAKVSSGLTKNPYAFWRNPFQWSRWRRIQLLHRDYAATRVELNEFEQGVLIPEMRSRVEFMLERFTEMQRICKDPVVGAYLAPALRTILQGTVGAPPAEDVAAKYLKETSEVIENSFLSRLRRIAIEYKSVDDFSTLVRFLNDFRVVCSSIVAPENILFHYQLVVRPYVVEKASGKILTDEPKELDIVLTPFRPSIEELRRTADSSEKTIDHWRQQLDASKKPFLDFLAASTNAATSRRTILIQILAITLALSFSTFFLTARDPFVLARTNAALKVELQEARDLASKQAFEIEWLKNELQAAQQSKSVPPPSGP